MMRMWLAPFRLLASLLWVATHTLWWGGLAWLGFYSGAGEPWLDRCYAGWVMSWRRLFVRLPIRWQMPSECPQAAHTLVTPNHQSWGDIPVLLFALQPHLPRLRFIMKASLQHIPLIGWFCQKAGYVLVQRDTLATLKRHPERRGEDARRITEATHALLDQRAALVVFPEGTRATPNKRRPPWRSVLPPQAKSPRLILQTWHDALWLDVHVHYAHPRPHFIKLLCGLIPEITLTWVQRHPSDAWRQGDKQACQRELLAWWQDKDDWLRTHHEKKTP